MVDVVGPEPVAVLEVALSSRAARSRVVGSDLRLVRSLRFTPEIRGTFGIEVRAVDVLGCTGSSAGQVRNVVVR